MSRLLPRLHPLSATLLVGLAAAQAAAQGAFPDRAVMSPAPGVQLSYERLGADDAASSAARIDGSLSTPAGTLRTTVQAQQNEERTLQRGDTSFELPKGVLGGQLQLHDLQTGGSAAAWRARLAPGFSAKTRAERTPVRNGQALQLRQEFKDGDAAQAELSNSKTATAQGSRWDVEFARTDGLSLWTAGVEAAQRSYVSESGSLEARSGVRLGTQWPLLPRTHMEVRYTRHEHWDAEKPVSSVMVGTRFDLPLRASLATSVETDAAANHKASLTITVPLASR